MAAFSPSRVGGNCCTCVTCGVAYVAGFTATAPWLPGKTVVTGPEAGALGTWPEGTVWTMVGPWDTSMVSTPGCTTEEAGRTVKPGAAMAGTDGPEGVVRNGQKRD